MSRTRRNVPYNTYWGTTKTEAKIIWEKEKEDHCSWNNWEYLLKRSYLLHGTDAKNDCYPTHEYFNRAHRVGRRVARDQLRPHIVLGQDFDFDDSHYTRKYKGVWWEIY